MKDFDLLLFMSIVSALSLIIAIISICLTLKTKHRYEKIAMKLGNGENLADILDKYISHVSALDEKDDQIIDYYNKLNIELNKCIKKVGLVKYNLYATTKNDLSFSLALLDNENNGFVINSVYGVDASNIYAKNIINGSCKVKLSEEEAQAVKIAMENE